MVFTILSVTVNETLNPSASIVVLLGPQNLKYLQSGFVQRKLADL